MTGKLLRGLTTADPLFHHVTQLLEHHSEETLLAAVQAVPEPDVTWVGAMSFFGNGIPYEPEHQAPICADWLEERGAVQLAQVLRQFWLGGYAGGIVLMYLFCNVFDSEQLMGKKSRVFDKSVVVRRNVAIPQDWPASGQSRNAVERDLLGWVQAYRAAEIVALRFGGRGGPFTKFCNLSVAELRQLYAGCYVDVAFRYLVTS